MIQQSWRLYLVFEFVDRDLKKHMDKQVGPLDYAQVKSYTFQMIKGIEYCHNRGIMHRDLKPQNLLVSDAGQLKIADFGLARAFVPPVRPFTHEVVTLWYRPPEILLGEPTYALPVDLWAVGAILVEMLNKRPLFPGDSEIDELFRIFRVMGTPNESNWPEGTKLPDFNSMWPQWPVMDIAKFVPTLDATGVDLIQGLLSLDPRDRLSASEACAHPFFAGMTLQIPPTAAPPVQNIAPKQRLDPMRVEDPAHMNSSAFRFENDSYGGVHSGLNNNNKENNTEEPAAKIAKGGR